MFLCRIVFADLAPPRNPPGRTSLLARCPGFLQRTRPVPIAPAWRASGGGFGLSVGLGLNVGRGFWTRCAGGNGVVRAVLLWGCAEACRRPWCSRWRLGTDAKPPAAQRYA